MSRYSPVEHRLRRETMSRTPAPEKKSSSWVPLMGMVAVIVAVVAIISFTEREPYEPPSLDAQINEINNKAVAAQKEADAETERQLSAGGVPDLQQLKEQIDQQELQRQEQRQQNAENRMSRYGLRALIIAVVGMLMLWFRFR